MQFVSTDEVSELFTGWCVWIFVLLEASLKLFDLLLLCGNLVSQKLVLKLFDYKRLAE